MRLCELRVENDGNSVKLCVRPCDISGGYVVSMYSDGVVFIFPEDFGNSGVESLET